MATFSITPFSTIQFGITTLRITTFSLMMIKNDYPATFRHAVIFTSMLSVFILNAIMEKAVSNNIVLHQSQTNGIMWALRNCPKRNNPETRKNPKH